MTSEMLAQNNAPDLMDYLQKRRSVPIKDLGDPGPSDEQIQQILQIATRVPDHGRMCPWYYMVIKGQARADIGEIVMWAYKEQDRQATPAKLELESARFTRAPVVIAVVSRLRKGRNPQWEQILSAGACCQDLCMAANALGFGTNWVTEWYSYNETFRSELGLDERDHIAGFIHIGTPSAQPEERERPDLEKIVNHWEAGSRLNKGDEYDQPGMIFPETGVKLIDH